MQKSFDERITAMQQKVAEAQSKLEEDAALVEGLKKTTSGLQVDRKNLAKTVQDQTLTLKSQLEDFQKAKETMQKSFDEREDLAKKQTLTLKSQLEDYQKAKNTMQKSFDERMTAMQQKVAEAQAKLEDDAALVEDLKQTKAGLQVDKKDLVKTVQNQTLTLKSQLEDFQKAKNTMQKSFDERMTAMQ